MPAHTHKEYNELPRLEAADIAMRRSWLSACTSSILTWMAFLLAVLFYVLTTLYAWQPDLFSQFEIIGGSPAIALRLLAILSGIANPLLSAVIAHSFDILRGALVARRRGHNLADNWPLHPETGIPQLVNIIFNWRLPRFKPRAWSALKLISMIIVPSLGILILSNVEVIPTFYPVTWVDPAHGYGIGTFNASLAPLLQPMTDLLFSTRFKDFLSDSTLSIDITDEADREDCASGVQTACRTEYYVPGGIQNFAPALLDNSNFTNADPIQPVIAMDQQGYNFEFEDDSTPMQYNPKTDCITSGFALGGFQLCLKNEEPNQFKAYITRCPKELAANMSCLSNTSWQSQDGWGTTLTLFTRRANIVYNGLNGTILSHEFSSLSRTPVNISASELLQVFNTILAPVDRNSTYGQVLSTLGLGNNKPVLPLSVWQYFQGLYELSQSDPRTNQQAIVGLQSLLAVLLYHCQAKDFAELRQLLLAQANNSSSIIGQAVGQIILSLFPEVAPDTEIYPALMRYSPQVDRRTLIAYIVLAGFTLALCLAAHVVGSCTSLGRKVQDLSQFSWLNCLVDSDILYKDSGDQVPREVFLELSGKDESEKLLEIAKLQAVLASRDRTRRGQDKSSLNPSTANSMSSTLNRRQTC